MYSYRANVPPAVHSVCGTMMESDGGILIAAQRFALVYITSATSSLSVRLPPPLPSHLNILIRQVLHSFLQLLA
jgi:hypothetical protein